MAVINFHEADDIHAPFPHRVVHLCERTVRVSKFRQIHFPEQNFIICAECDHWILTYAKCDCPQRCHDLGRLVDSLPAGTV